MPNQEMGVWTARTTNRLSCDRVEPAEWRKWTASAARKSDATRTSRASCRAVQYPRVLRVPPLIPAGRLQRTDELCIEAGRPTAYAGRVAAVLLVNNRTNAAVSVYAGVSPGSDAAVTELQLLPLVDDQKGIIASGPASTAHQWWSAGDRTQHRGIRAREPLKPVPEVVAVGATSLPSRWRVPDWPTLPRGVGALPRILIYPNIGHIWNISYSPYMEYIL